MTKKRSRYGDGTIFQRSDGMWIAQVSLGTDANGKRRRKTITATTKSGALAKLRTERTKPKTAGDAQDVNSYLESYLAHRKSELSPTSHARYECLYRNQIQPYFRNVRLDAVDAQIVQRWYERLTADGHSADAQHKAAILMGHAFRLAVVTQRVISNPFRDVPKPRVERHEIEILTSEQARRLITASVSSNYSAMIVLALATGMRQGELFALAWEDIDEQRQTVIVSKSLEEIAGKLRIKRPKTKAGRRTVAIDRDTLATLQEHRRWCQVQNMYRPEIVFPGKAGSYLRKSNFHRRHWKPLLERAGLPDVTFHSLRHYHVSVLCEAGESLKSIQSRVGHADYKTTLAIYARVMDKDSRSAADAIGSVLFGEDH